MSLKSPQRAIQSEGWSQGLHVLFVDDDPTWRDLMARKLSRVDESMTVITRANVESALDCLAREHVDAIVCDYKLGEFDGLDMVERVRTEHGDIPFLLFTGRGDEAVASEAIRAGVDDYLRKDADKETVSLLANRIENLVERDRMRRNLERREHRFTKLLAHSPVVTRLMDADGTNLYVSPAAEAVLGYEASRLLGESGFEYIHPDDREHVRDVYDRLVETGHGISTAEYRYRHGSGDWLWVRSRARNLMDDAVIGALVINTEDISAEKERQRELETHKRVLDVQPDGVYTMDADGHFMSVNNRMTELTGYTADELVGRHATELTRRDDMEEGRSAIQTLISNPDREVVNVNERIERADGSTFPAETRISLLPSEGGFRGTVGTVRDISDRRRRERLLQQQNERLEEFASVVSHDLRNPLNVITGNVDLLRETVEEQPLDRIEAAAGRMDDLVEDLLTLAKQGQTIGETDPVDLPSAIERAWSIVDTESASLVIEADDTVVQADEERLLAVFENLFANAIEHGGPGVTVTCGTIPGSGFYVADDGAGFPAEVADHLFEHGYSGSADGTGFGLTIVRTIVEAHGWAIAATESEAGGARFEIATELSST